MFDVIEFVYCLVIPGPTLDTFTALHIQQIHIKTFNYKQNTSVLHVKKWFYPLTTKAYSHIKMYYFHKKKFRFDSNNHFSDIMINIRLLVITDPPPRSLPPVLHYVRNEEFKKY